MDPPDITQAGDGGARGGTPGPAVKAQAPCWSAKQARRMDGDTLLRRMVAVCLAQVAPNAAALASGSRDPEHVHQLRVGLRRLRSVVAGMEPFAAPLPAGWEGAIRPVFDALGDLRDAHVRSTTLAPKLRRAGAPLADLGGPCGAAHAALARCVRGAAFQGMLRRLQAYAGAPGAGEAGSGLAHLRRRCAGSRARSRATPVASTSDPSRASTACASA